MTIYPDEQKTSLIERMLPPQTLADFKTNLQLLWHPHTYTRSHRMGGLYEQELYAQVAGGPPAGAPRQLS